MMIFTHRDGFRTRHTAGARLPNPAFLGRLALLLLILAALLPIPVQAADAAQEMDANATVRVRIGVTRDGIVVVGPADLAAAGIKTSTLDPRTFSMSSLGKPVAIIVTGDGDGKFDGSDRLYFFGQKFRGAEMDQKYTDERVYWLDVGGAPGPRIASVAGEPQYDRTPAKDFATTLRAEDNTQWWSLHTITLDTQDTWFWARSQPIRLGPDAVVTATLPFTVPYPAPGVPANFRMEQISRAYRWDKNPDHRTTLTFNGTSLLDAQRQTWDGLHVRKVFTATLSAANLKHGTNVVAAGNWTVPGVETDDIYTNYWELDYRREFKAFEGQLDFKAENAGAQEYEVSGWASGPVWTWDISDPNSPVRVAVADLDNRLFLPMIRGGGAGAAGVDAAPAASVRFRATGQAGSRYWLQEKPTFRAPASIRLRPPTGLRDGSNGADAVLVAPAYLLDAAKPLVNWHIAQGRRAILVDIQDVYDEFNEGIYHPKAIQALMKWATANWTAPAPSYLTLVGDGHWNFKGYNPALYPPQPNPIPPLLSWVDIWQGEVPTDSRLGDVNDDGIPEIAVGRLPVNTPAEAQVVIQKIINYDQGTRSQAWQKRAFFVADNADYAGEYPTLTNEIIAGYTPADLEPIKAYLSEAPTGTPATNAEIIAARNKIPETIQAGVFMVQYSGHGAPERWAQEYRTDVVGDAPGIWRAGDVAGLTNGAKLPVVLTFNCLDGYFVHSNPAAFSLAELMLRRPGGGSIAAISPTGLGMSDAQHDFRKILLDVMFKENVRELGRALTITKQRFSKTYGRHYLVDTMTLFGDPALRLPAQGAQQ